MGDGGNFSFLIDEDAERSLLSVEIEMQLALRIHDVEVLEAGESSLGDGCLLLGLVAVSAQSEEPDLARPLGFVGLDGLLEVVHVLQTEFAGRGPETDHGHLALLEVDAGQLVGVECCHVVEVTNLLANVKPHKDVVLDA